jgi:hypothetical protein
MLKGLVNSQVVRTQKAIQSSQSSEKSFVPCHSEERPEIEKLKESLGQRDEEMRRWDEAMMQWEEYYSQAFAQQQAMLQVN